MRAAVILVAALGVSCTEDRPGPRAAPSATPSAATAVPTACPRPGPVPEGFVLSQSRDAFQDGPAHREVFQHPDGRLLVFLLGVDGEIGEGSPVAEPIELTGGRQGTLFGTPEHDSWTLDWEAEPPCEQMAIVGNGFSRESFLAAMAEVGLVEV